MKFGKSILQNSIPEWRSLYIDYRSLKMYIKNMLKENEGATAIDPEHPSVKAFEERLELEIDKINGFFSTKEQEAIDKSTELHNQLAHLQDQIEALGEKGAKLGRSVRDLTSSRGVWSEGNGASPSLTPGDTSVELNVLPSLDGPACPMASPSPASPALSSPIFSSPSVSTKSLLSPGPAISSVVKKTKAYKNVLSKFKLKGKGAVRVETIKHAMQTLEKAFLEFYRLLILLRNYQVLNYTGFNKILKKADKRSGLMLKRKYINTIDSLHFHTTQHVNEMLSTTEEAFARGFHSGNIFEAKRLLRVPDEHDKTHHTISFLNGLMLGMILMLTLVIVGAVFTASSTYFPRPREVYNVYAAMGLPLLFFWALGFDEVIWTRFSVNYAFIFEFDPRRPNSYHKYFEAVSILTLMWVASIAVYVWTATGTFPLPLEATLRPELQPLVLLGIFFLILVCPFNWFYRKGRLWLLNVLGRIAAAPFVAVKFKDFFFADQLSSLTLFMVSLQFTVCFYAYDVWRPEDQGRCWQVNSYVSPFVSFLPYWFRFMQCWRRFHDSKHDRVHLKNALKYFLSMLVTLFSGLDANITLQHTTAMSPLRIVWFIVSAMAASYALYWDLTHDWGVLIRVPNVTAISNGAEKHQQPRTRQLWGWTLRQRRMYVRPWPYYLAIFLDVIFRFLWPLTKSVSQIGSVLQNWQLVGILGAVEIMRRCMWNLFRLENEHLNNVGKFRAVRDIPLPFGSG
eukprot:TRINITY_DN3838_c0_g1_i2.p1 TRINITY_DN3838_c0_g1~~TRINITY_DN3838_c0_g1_i2.p1  ORF type:complete len:737 (-),score=154.45 TRINITY_DN3838_c0_g1_i2:17-2227(-)